MSARDLDNTDHRRQALHWRLTVVTRARSIRTIAGTAGNLLEQLSKVTEETRKWIRVRRVLGCAYLAAALCGPFEELSRLNLELLGKLTYDFDTDVVLALFEQA